MLVRNDTVGDLVDRIMSEDPTTPIGFDTETTGLSAYVDRVVGFSISCGSRHGVYLPVRHERILEEEVQVKQGRKKLGPPKVLRAEPHPLNLGLDVAATVIRALVESKRPLAMHNAAFDLTMAAKEGWVFPVTQRVCDTKIAKWLLCRGVKLTGPKPYGLKTLARKDLGHEMTEFEDVADPRGIQYTDPEVAAEYAADDARSTLRLWLRYEKEMRESWAADGFERIYHDLEMPAARVVAHMRSAGVLVERDTLLDCNRQMVEEQAKIQEKLNGIVQGEFPTTQVQKLSRLMYDILRWWDFDGMERGKARAKGDPLGFYSTDEESLVRQLSRAKDRQGTEIALLLLRWRKLETIRSRYTVSLSDKADPDGRIRCEFAQTNTDTGRYAAAHPNLQQVPRPAESAAENVWERNLPTIRAAFLSALGKLLLDVDFSQIELRLMAHFSQDPALLAAYRTWKCGKCGAAGETDIVLYTCPVCGALDHRVVDGKKKRAKMDLEGNPELGCFCLGFDIHQLTASQVGCTRQTAKPINFGLIYGMSAWKLSKTVNVSEAEATRYIAKYFTAYPGVRQYHRRVERQLLDRWYVRTMTGRHRRFDKVPVEHDDDGRPRGRYGHVFRAAVNATIQGSGADLMKLAMRNLHRAMLDKGELDRRFWILATVHDELICEVTEDYATDAMGIVQNVFEHAIRLRVPIIAEPAVGRRWNEIH